MGGQGRIELDVAARFEAIKTGDLVDLAENAVVVAVAAVGGNAVAHGTRVGAPELDAPRLLPCSLGETQLVQGDRDLYDVAEIGDLSGGVPDDVPGEIFHELDLTEDGVCLDTERIDSELEGSTFVVERVEHERDLVVLDEGVDRVTIHEVGADRTRVGVVGLESDIEIIVVIGDERLRSDRRLDLIARKPLVGQLNRCCFGPGHLVELGVDLDRRRRPQCTVMLNCYGPRILGKARRCASDENHDMCQSRDCCFHEPPTTGGRSPHEFYAPMSTRFPVVGESRISTAQSWVPSRHLCSFRSATNTTRSLTGRCVVREAHGPSINRLCRTESDNRGLVGYSFGLS